jgi:hypothetical protein
MTYPAGGRIPTTGSIRSLNFGSVEILSVLRRGDQRRGMSATARRTGNPMASGREECTVGARSGQGAGQAHTRSSGDSIRSADWWAAYRPIADLQAPQLTASKGSAPPVRGPPRARAPSRRSLTSQEQPPRCPEAETAMRGTAAAREIGTRRGGNCSSDFLVWPRFRPAPISADRPADGAVSAVPGRAGKTDFASQADQQYAFRGQQGPRAGIGRGCDGRCCG